jgi:tRNA-2-methylthio-N6-dimethylallyladenosine synthase
MNRQYTRNDFLHLADRVRAAFDRPALTTDVIVGFPGETDAEFQRTLEVVDHAGFIHVHAFSFSPRPGTAAARWTRDFVRGPVVNERIARLRSRAEAHSLAFRRQFLGQTVELLVERGGDDPTEANPAHAVPGTRHGRCERYFDVRFDARGVGAGDFVRVQVKNVFPDRTEGTFVGACG